MDGISRFKAIFGVRPRYAHDPPDLEYVASDAAPIREFEVTAMKAARAPRAVPMSSSPEAKLQGWRFGVDASQEGC